MSSTGIIVVVHQAALGRFERRLAVAVEGYLLVDLLNRFDIRALLLFAFGVDSRPVVVPRPGLAQQLTLPANGQLLVIRLDEIPRY